MTAILHVFQMKLASKIDIWVAQKYLLWTLSTLSPLISKTFRGPIWQVALMAHDRRKYRGSHFILFWLRLKQKSIKHRYILLWREQMDVPWHQHWKTSLSNNLCAGRGGCNVIVTLREQSVSILCSMETCFLYTVTCAVLVNPPHLTS